MLEQLKWQDDYGCKPKYTTPPCVESGENKNCSKEEFLNWADNQWAYKYCLILRQGTIEWNARFCVDDKLLRQLEHGKFYTWKELGSKGEGKVQFIVEDLKPQLKE